MRRQTQSIIALIVGLTVFYNIERLDIGETNTINLDSFVYVLAPVAVIAIVGMPVLRRSRLSVLEALWGGSYVVSKVLLWAFFEGRPLLGGIYTYLGITEMAFLALGLAYPEARYRPARL